ncbi:hypothetical protein LXL04_036935 [Taraxacum kok-saghyz]
MMMMTAREEKKSNDGELVKGRFITNKKQRVVNGRKGNESRAWKLTTFQRLDFTCDDVLDSLKEENIIGKGGVGIVYKGVMPNNEHVEVRP